MQACSLHGPDAAPMPNIAALSRTVTADLFPAPGGVSATGCQMHMRLAVVAPARAGDEVPV
ncbi:MAG: hypothetical protein B7Y28_04275 [Polaromonas sp. 16-63-31]|nr:MAG: hypothetical protein B7Y60_02845 [Polaromonas sp. 35-63-35]OYZ22082.1 MAG: hypothetical protein B7Y28_04275 [Polaromonas sp. 16-63-31]OZA51582.1 MAG: hypothetical protein B7X88_08330 [Polaromonas sp. 17-63-33]